jgi:hypothetical protein
MMCVCTHNAVQGQMRSVLYEHVRKEGGEVREVRYYSSTGGKVNCSDSRHPSDNLSHMATEVFDIVVESQV